MQNTITIYNTLFTLYFISITYTKVLNIFEINYLVKLYFKVNICLGLY